MMTLKIYTEGGDKILVDVEDKTAALELMVKHGLQFNEVELLDENLETVNFGTVNF